MKKFKKLAIAATVSGLMMGAQAAQAHVSYFTGNTGGPATNGNAANGAGSWTDSTGPAGYAGNLPVNWIAHVHNDTNPVVSYEVSDADAIAEGAASGYNLQSPNNKWHIGTSWGAALAYGLVDLHAGSWVDITVSAADGSTFTPGVTLWNSWDASTGSSKHQSWNNGPTAADASPLGSAELSYNDSAATTTAGGSVTIHKYLAAGDYTLFIGGNGTGGTSGIDQSYKVNIATSVVPVPAAVWLFGGALVSLFSVNRRKKAMPV